MKTILLTGATRGLGRAMARALGSDPDVSLVLAVRDVAEGKRVAASLPHGAEVVRLDMSLLGDVTQFARAWDRPLYALVNNAGLQQTRTTEHTSEGFEMTFAVNHLGATWLTLGLLPQLRGGIALGIGSGTHNPDNPMARRFGFRGGRAELPVDVLARGDQMDASSERQRGMDRYATSKLLSMAATFELARRYPETTFATLDPGMMPGTDLARTAPWIARVAWSTVLRWLVPVLPDASTTERSARAARTLLLETPCTSGEVYDFHAQPSKRVWPQARTREFGQRVLDETLALLSPRWPHAEQRTFTSKRENGVSSDVA